MAEFGVSFSVILPFGKCYRAALAAVDQLCNIGVEAELQVTTTNVLDCDSDTWSVWMASDYSHAELGDAVDVLCSIQKEYGIDGPWAFEYASTCSRPVVGAFGGGAIVIYEGTEYSICTCEKMQELVEQVVNKK